MLIYDPKEHPYNPALDHPLSPCGRFGRLAYLAWYLILSLALILIALVGAFIFGMLGSSTDTIENLGAAGIIALGIVYLVFFYYAIVITIRRLHDLGQTGWLSLLMFVPLINIGFMLYVMFAKGTPANNEFGAPRPNKAWENVLGKIYIALTVIGLIFAGIVFATSYNSYMEQVNLQQMQSY